MSKDQRLEQLRKNHYSWCSDDQWECCKMVFDLIGGEHHLCGKIKEWGTGIAYNNRYPPLATFDGSILTTAVFMSHDRMIRFEINPSGPGMLKWCLWKRHSRDGQFWDKHPKIETALEVYRKNHPDPDDPPFPDENSDKIEEGE